MSPETSPDCGFVFAATGGGYTDLAVAAAESLRDTNPGVAIDLFTDQVVDRPVFDEIHALDHNFFRPKFEALRRSRFQRTVYLDADIVVVADIRDIFEVLARFDFAAVHEQRRNTPYSTMELAKRPPNAFPQVNGGLMGVRKTAPVETLLSQVEATIRNHGLGRDQFVLRELLFESDLRIAILPPEYNLMDVRLVEAQSQKSTAPRVLHLSRMHNHFTRAKGQLRTAEQVLGKDVWRHIQKMIANDVTLGGTWRGRLRPLMDQGVPGVLRSISRNLSRGRARLRRRDVGTQPPRRPPS